MGMPFGGAIVARSKAIAILAISFLITGAMALPASVSANTPAEVYLNAQGNANAQYADGGDNMVGGHAYVYATTCDATDCHILEAGYSFGPCPAIDGASTYGVGWEDWDYTSCDVGSPWNSAYPLMTDYVSHVVEVTSDYTVDGKNYTTASTINAPLASVLFTRYY